PGGELTTKGGVLEVYMGHYTREWLVAQGLIPSGECPAPDTVYIQRGEIVIADLRRREFFQHANRGRGGKHPVNLVFLDNFPPDPA
ncbi:hypothetical protein MJN85_28385, partial [Salmonella enterica subsp. enterica serovar Anatum]|nr:hypothetical protein [Salmonella enterica subsp. enterica serovar Anatum]